MAQQSMGRGGPSGLADVLEVLLDKGLVIDAFVRVSLVGIELLTIDARVVIASVDTYLHFAEAVNRLDLVTGTNAQSLSDILGDGDKSRGGHDGPAALSKAPAEDDSDDEQRAELEPALGKDAAGEDENVRRSQSDSQGRDDDSGSNDKTIFSRIKERGQVF
ncbi:MAG: gas vesicle protein [Actinomycetota bacterium]|nr:gas vesicle protein [Actinomycetota bacterium]